MDPMIRDVLDLILKCLTPIAVAYSGYRISVNLENFKTNISRNSEFNKKWADKILEEGFEYLNLTNKIAEVLSEMSHLKQLNLQKEMKLLDPELTQLGRQLMVSQYSITSLFTLLKKESSTNSEGNSIKKLEEALKIITDKTIAFCTDRSGDFTELTNNKESLLIALRDVHKEMLKIKQGETKP